MTHLNDLLSFQKTKTMKFFSFNPYNKLCRLTEGNYILTKKYGPDQKRCKSELSTILNGSVQTTKYFLSNYEKIIDNGTVYEINYIAAPSGLCAMYVTTNGAGKMYYVYSDHLGSILKVTDHNGTTYEQNFDAWGRYRNPETWEYTGIPVNPVWLHRGFTSHEHLQEFVLINMNGRLYDPVVGAMLSPDNYVADATSASAYNRYSYCLNNPFKYTDPSGDFIFTALAVVTGQWWALPMAIGADIGMWQGGSLANGTMNPFKWDYNSGRTWSYMAAGTSVGAASGGVAGAVATSGMVGANTSAIMAASFVNSAGTAMYTGGQTDVSVSFGFGSYNFNTGEFGYLGKKGNSTLENIGYGLGALANLSDLGRAGDMLYNVEKKDAINHAAIKDGSGNTVISYGPGDSPKYDYLNAGDSNFQHYGKMLGGIRGTNDYPIHGGDIALRGVNTTMIKGYGKMLSYLSDKGLAPYSFVYSSCSTHAGLAMWFAGVPNLFLHPYTLQASVWLWNQGITPALIQNSYHLTIGK